MTGGLSPSTLDRPAAAVRAVTVERSGAVVVEETDGPGLGAFPAAVMTPKDASAPATDGSPRQAWPSSKLWWAPDALGVSAPEMEVGSRVLLTDTGQTYELISHPRAMRGGTVIYSYHADVLPLDVLYPFDATLEELGGEPVVEAPEGLAVAIWQGSTLDRSTGRANFVDPQAEAPAEFAPFLVGSRNRQLRVGERVYKIANASFNNQGRFVAMNLSREDR